MTSKQTNKAQFVLLPSVGMAVPEADAHQAKLFRSLHKSSASSSRLHSSSAATRSVAVTVVDSIGETKAKLIEVALDDLPAFRSAHPSARLLPLVYYQRAVL